jgi:hypothetical protein
MAEDVTRERPTCAFPLAGLEESILFKTGIDLGKNHFSGLFLVKPTGADEVRILFLSELGLNLLDMHYSNGQFEVVSVKEFLNRKTLLKTLQNDFRSLLLDLSGPELRATGKQQPAGEEKSWKFSERRSRYRLTCRADGSMHARRRSGLCKRTDITSFSQDELQRVTIRHRGIRLQLDLVELKR